MTALPEMNVLLFAMRVMNINTNMRTPEQLEAIGEYEADIADEKKALEHAEVELANAQDWLMKRKVYYAEAIIKLNDYLKEHE
jgi:hypothetical protein